MTYEASTRGTAPETSHTADRMRTIAWASEISGVGTVIVPSGMGGRCQRNREADHHRIEPGNRQTKPSSTRDDHIMSPSDRLNACPHGRRADGSALEIVPIIIARPSCWTAKKTIQNSGQRSLPQSASITRAPQRTAWCGSRASRAPV